MGHTPIKQASGAHVSETEGKGRNAMPLTEYQQVYQRADVYTDIALQIVQLRWRLGLSQEALAQALGTQQPAVSRFEDVNYTGWHVETLIRVAHALGKRLVIRFEDPISAAEDAP
jgi:ribosome-binding protein aMBF1 (putative translation factor)